MVTAIVPERELIEAGDYAAKLLSIEDANSVNGPCWKWSFELTEVIGSDGRPVRLTAMSSAGFGYSIKAKVNRWYLALSGREAERGAPVSMDDLFGTACRLRVSMSDDGQFNRVSEVLSTAQPRLRTLQPAPRPQADDDINPDDLPF